MARKPDKSPKASRQGSGKTGRWTVRGVPVRLQRAAGDAARAEGKTVGQWLSQLLADSTARGPARPAAPVGGWGETIERRLLHLAEAVFGAGAATEPAPDPEPRVEPPADSVAA